jgi:hypothetical protein
MSTIDNVRDTDEDKDGILIDQLSDNELITLANERYNEDKILEAYRILQKIENRSCLGENEKAICSVATECASAIADLLDEPDNIESSGWMKQGECHGDYDTVIYYKVDKTNGHLTCRLETPIESKLLIPLLSVLNESNLYTDWCPSWSKPINIGICTSEHVQRIGRVNQLIHVIGKFPWPFLPREVYLQTIAIDEIDDHGYFAVRLFSSQPGGMIPTPQPTVERIDFKGVLLFRPGSFDHPNLVMSSQDKKVNGRNPLILVSFKM